MWPSTGTRSTLSGSDGRRTYSEVVMEGTEDAMSVMSGLSLDESRSRTTSQPPDLEHINFYSGNPFVEKCEGVVHFVKYNAEAQARVQQCRMLCMLAVPCETTCSELVSFVGGNMTGIEQMKIVRDPTPNQYIVLIRFVTPSDCLEFFHDLSGQFFSSLEPHKCNLLFVDRIESTSEECMTAVSHAHADLPTCAVCLEKMEKNVLSILCNHTFHAACLQKWTDTTCPVCRYTQTPEIVADQRCNECGQANDLWICLICGHIGHFEDTSHTFCVQVGGERVWDFAGDDFVHRLIQADEGSKIVEYTRGGSGYAEADSEKGGEKLEAIRVEYTKLLTEQLESQRIFFEAKLNDERRAHGNFEKLAQAQMDDMEQQLKRVVDECESLSGQLNAVDQSRSALEKKQTQGNAKMNKVMKELEEIRSINRLLESDEGKWRDELETAEKERKTHRETLEAKVAALEAKLALLYSKLEETQQVTEGET